MTAKITRLDPTRKKATTKPPTPADKPPPAEPEVWGGVYTVMTDVCYPGDRDPEGNVIEPGDMCGRFAMRVAAGSRGLALREFARNEGYENLTDACVALDLDAARVDAICEGRLILERDPEFGGFCHAHCRPKAAP
jgi:hypothetical protein